MFAVVCVSLVVAAALLSLCVAAWVLYVPLVARCAVQIPWLNAPSQPPLFEGESCRFPTGDGLMLEGTYLETTAERRLGVIACCHELTGDRWTMLPYAEDLRGRGFDVFLFDFRNHGRSGAVPGYEPLPWLTRYELLDVQAVLAYLASRCDADPRGVGLFGVSRGGSAALCAAARDRRVQAVVTDGAFGTMAMQVHYMRRYMSIFTLYTQYFSRLPDWVLASLVRVAHGVVGYHRRVQFVAIESSARRVRQPVLMIHGEADPFVPLSVARNLKRQLHRATFWSVPGARHNAALRVAPEEYRRRVARFFLKHLAAGRRQPVAPVAAEAEAVS